MLSLPLFSDPQPPAAPGRLRGAIVALMAALVLAPAALAQQSTLLESVRQNPQRGKALCQQLRGYNAQGVSFTASQVTAAVASQQGLSQADAEVLITYVVGFYCPEVR
jgi:hypothetical protein